MAEPAAAQGATIEGGGDGGDGDGDSYGGGGNTVHAVCIDGIAAMVTGT